mmetsp:Transcript_14520/g.31944  ORF Transcript_14520/g.31944 Transcript_14520/m.31944 type:complete len:165 (-) Transcript_14520:10-504(-)
MAFMRHLPHRPSTGEKKTNRNLRLGVFTQDLAQELDADSRAVDLVTAHAREGAGGDISISDLQARNAMGALGLSGDKPLRLVQDLSGGEKARVALSMFALRPSNVSAPGPEPVPSEVARLTSFPRRLPHRCCCWTNPRITSTWAASTPSPRPSADGAATTPRWA